MMKGEQRGETDQLKARLEMLHRRGGTGRTSLNMGKYKE